MKFHLLLALILFSAGAQAQLIGFGPSDYRTPAIIDADGGCFRDFKNTSPEGHTNQPFDWDLAPNIACATSTAVGNAKEEVPAGLEKADWSGICAAYEAGRHEVRAVEGGHQAENPGQGWLTKFDGRGFIAQPAGADWQWGLELAGYGFPGNERSVSGNAVAQATGQRLSYQWDAAVQEWYVNDQRGLEHGFTVAERPMEFASTSTAQAEPLAFQMLVRGGLRPQLSADAQMVSFHDAAGAVVVNYAGLKVWDADGKILPSRFASAPAASQPGFRLLVDERGARYPLTVDPVAQQAYLKASNTRAGNTFGSDVAVFGDTVVVGAFREDSSSTGINSSPNEGAAEAGAVYVFVQSGAGVWSQQAYLKASNTGAGDLFGRSVAISGDTVVVGAYEEASNASGVNGDQADNTAFGSGAAYVFTRSGAGVWSQQAYLKASNTGARDHFGCSVAISGNTVMVGALWEDSGATGVNGNQANNSAENSGAAYVFTRSGAGVWSQQAYLKASNTDAGDRFGCSVAISGNTVMVGALWEDSGATGVNGNQANNSAENSGAAYVFTRSGADWSQQAYLKASNTGGGDEFGRALAVSGSSIVIGSLYEDSNATGVNVPLTGGTNTQADNSAGGSGAAYVFSRSGATWSQQAYLKASNTGISDFFGSSVGISGDTVVVGAGWERSNATGVNGNQADNTAALSGAAYVFTRSGTSWSQQAYLKASNTGADDRFGAAVAVSGETVVVGAYQEGSAATGVNGTGADNSAPDAGAAYTFSFNPALPQITTEPATAGSISSTGATANARVFPNFSATTVTMEYGISPSGPTTTVAVTGTFNGSGPEMASRALSGLLPGRTYRYRAYATNGVGGALLPAVAPFGFLTFTTAAAAPTVTTLAATGITSTSAVLDGTVFANGASADVFFSGYAPGGVGAFTQVATPTPVTGTEGTPVTTTITGLLPGTTYVFSARATNSVGDAPLNNLSFTTLPDPLVGGLAEPLNVPVAGGGFHGSVIQPDGKTILFGSFTSVYGTPHGRMARLLADGTLEGGLGFNPGANGPITCAALLADGKIMIGGDFTTLQPRGTGTVFTRNRLARLLSDGTVDPTFANPGVNAFVLGLVVQQDGAVLVGGDFNGASSFMGATRNRIARITAAGALDTGFNPNANAPVYAMAQELDGNLIVGGEFTTMAGQSRVRIARLNRVTGLPEPGYGTLGGASDLVFSITLQRDGRAVIGGSFTNINGTGRNKLARLNADGTLDLTFAPNVTGGNVFSMVLQANQKLMIAGSFSAIGGSPRNKVARVNTAGVLDGFNPNVTGGDVLSIALQADGKAQLGGTFTTISGGTSRAGYALLSNETAYQTLEKRSATEVYWSRGGSAPEVLSVAFDLAAFSGSVFTPIGNGTRVDPLAGDWRLSGITPGLPLSGQIRVRARTASGYLSGSTGIMDSKVAYIHSLPLVTTVSVAGITGTTALLTGTVDTSTLTATPAFKLDTTTAYTQPLRIPSPASVTGTATFTYQVTGLTPGTAYVFRATAENAGGRVDGTEIAFTTLSHLHVDYKADGSDTAPTVGSYTATGRQVTFSLARPLAPGTTLMVVKNTGNTPITGTFANLAQGQAVNLTFGGVTYPYVAHYYGGTGNDLVLLWRNTRALAWGWNNLGQLGNADTANRGIPGDVFPSDPLTEKTVVSVSGGTHHSVALCVDGTIATWGDNLEGQLGTGDFVDRSNLVPVTVEQGFLPPGVHPVAISAGGSHTLALFSNGRVYAWGDNQYGQVGSNDAPVDHSTPAYAKGSLASKRVIGISAGEHHSLAVCDDGFVASWGRGEFGQLGNGSTADQEAPVAVDLSDVPVGETIVAVAAGRWHSMALTSGGKVFTWGRNTEGQLGNGATISQSFPILITGLTASAIYGGGTMHSMAMRTDGKLVAWGSNTFGQLGTGGLVNSYTPTVVSVTWLGGQSVSGAISGDRHNLALRSDGTLYAWGLGNEGRLGDNNTGIHVQAMQMPVVATALDPGDRWLSLGSGAACQHSLAIVALSLQPAVVTAGAEPQNATEASIYGIVRAHGVPVEVTFDYGLTNTYGTTVTATPATMNGTVPAWAVANLTGLRPGTTYHYQVKAVQAGISFALGGDRTFTTRSRLEMWRDLWFDTFENTGNAADGADLDRDGIPNLLEFAFGLSPQENSFGQLPAPQFFPGSIQYSFTEPDTDMGLTYGAEWSTNMTLGNWLPLTDLAFSPNHLFKLAPTGLDRVFLRLKVTVVPP